nr:hypothetical protein [Tanacetum cinerariifolium]
NGSDLTIHSRENLGSFIRCFDPCSGPKLSDVGNIDNGIDSQSIPNMGGLNKIHYLVKIDVVLILLQDGDHIMIITKSESCHNQDTVLLGLEMTLLEMSLVSLEGCEESSKQAVGTGQLPNNIDDKGYWDSGCSRHMTGNISYLSDYEPYDEGYVSFGQGGGKITGKGTKDAESQDVKKYVSSLRYSALPN